MRKWVAAEVEIEVDLDGYTDDDLTDEMEKRGFECIKAGPSTFDHVEHLIVCGQVEEAKNEALRLVAELIGREFK